MTALALDQVIDALQVLICGLDLGGKIHVFNRACERLTGIPRRDAIGLSWLELFAHGQRTDHVRSLWSGTADDAPSGPYEALCRNGRSLRWQFSRHGHETDRPLAMWAVGLDVTHEREALVRAREIERMQTLGNLVSGLTHELRNPLNGALLQLAVAARGISRHHEWAADPLAAAVAQATAEIRRVSSILDDFLVFVRPQPIHLERVDVRQVVARAVERSGFKAQAAGVTVVLEPGIHVGAEVDASRVESAAYHLIANAIDAAAEATDREARVCVVTTGNEVAIEVEDHGRGLASPDLPVFEPFFTTKQGGTGLGLAIVQRVATDHGGEITHERRLGATVFRLALPIVGGLAS